MEYFIGGIVVAFVTMQLSYRAFRFRIKQLEESRDAWKKSSASWEWAVEGLLEAYTQMHQTNTDLAHLVEMQRVHIDKLRRGNRDVPARNN